MKVKINNRPHRYYVNGTRPRHGRKYTKYRMSLSMMVLTYNHQHLSNI